LINSKHYLLLFFLLILAIFALIFSLLSGSIDISLTQLISLLTNPQDALINQVLKEIRLPRTLAGFTVGGLLAFSGVIMQALLRNPLADPYILGVSGGAAVGALCAILLGLSGFILTNFALSGALISVLIVFGFAHKFGNWSVTRLLLTGVVLSAGWGAIINILLATSTSNNVQSILFWLIGDLSQSRVGLIHYLLLLLGVFGGITMGKSLNVLSRGDLTAYSLGLNLNLLKLTLYFVASVFTAIAVTVAGSVGFVGLVTPHILRLLGARDHRVLIPCAILLGGSFVTIADSLARTIIAPQQLPVGAVTAIIGVPVFLIILHANTKR